MIQKAKPYEMLIQKKIGGAVMLHFFSCQRKGNHGHLSALVEKRLTNPCMSAGTKDLKRLVINEQENVIDECQVMHTNAQARNVENSSSRNPVTSSITPPKSS
jgi:hypothetical protein